MAKGSINFDELRSDSETIDVESEIPQSKKEYTEKTKKAKAEPKKSKMETVKTFSKIALSFVLFAMIFTLIGWFLNEIFGGHQPVKLNFYTVQPKIEVVTPPPQIEGYGQ